MRQTASEWLVEENKRLRELSKAQEVAIQALKSRIATLDAELAELRKRDPEPGLGSKVDFPTPRGSCLSGEEPYD